MPDGGGGGGGGGGGSRLSSNRALVPIFVLYSIPNLSILII